MAFHTGDPIILGVAPGALILQPDSRFRQSRHGLDTGHFEYITHSATPSSYWPKVGDAGKKHSKMFVTSVEDVQEDSTLIRLIVDYEGLLEPGDRKKSRIIPDCDVSIFTLPALEAEDGPKIQVVAPIPKPRLTREYCTNVQPTLDGVGETDAGGDLPDLPSFSISFVPDPDAVQTVNYFTGWILESRNWEEVLPGKGIWIVRESVAYYYNLAV